MNVLYVLNSTSIYGGASKSFLHLLKGLINLGVKPVIVVPDNNGICVTLRRMNVTTIDVPFKHHTYPAYNGLKNKLFFLPRLFGRIWMNHNAFYKLKKHLKGQNFDLVHTNVSVINIGFKLAKSMKIPHVYHFREFADLDFNMHYFPSKYFFYKKINKKNSFFITITNQIKNYHHLNEKNTKVIYNPISERLNHIDFSHDLNYFLFAGRLVPTKGLMEVIQAYVEYVKIIKNPLKLLIAGDQPDNNYIKDIYRIIQINNLQEHIEFLGPRSDIEMLMNNAKAIIVASKFEAFGRCMAEAMFHGCLVIGKNIAGTKEQFDNGIEFCGEEIGVRYNNKEDLVKALEYISEINWEDRKKIVSLAFKTVNELYSVNVSVKNVFDFYQRILNEEYS